MVEQETAKEMTIIPVASGKGGVGKSVITANLSVSLAEKGCRVVAVDLDLGGSNLSHLPWDWTTTTLVSATICVLNYGES